MRSLTGITFPAAPTAFDAVKEFKREKNLTAEEAEELLRWEHLAWAGSGYILEEVQYYQGRPVNPTTGEYLDSLRGFGPKT